MGSKSTFAPILRRAGVPTSSPQVSGRVRGPDLVESGLVRSVEVPAWDVDDPPALDPWIAAQVAGPKETQAFQVPKHCCASLRTA